MNIYGKAHEGKDLNEEDDDDFWSPNPRGKEGLSGAMLGGLVATIDAQAEEEEAGAQVGSGQSHQEKEPARLGRIWRRTADQMPSAPTSRSWRCRVPSSSSTDTPSAAESS